ncbi:PKD repeat-containing protein [Halorubrum aquaticum]|uniref:PKD repeat-containing protein n=1 Tax=Halorubrum aquaticum TaxID=387340 RepID=A0A1I3BP38_9EURY|nr:PKD domain-containing protein [Halorubrum aquaticum]SFH64058.1 PKD repeat-containing protein [Halorubrum aquaticum]
MDRRDVLRGVVGAGFGVGLSTTLAGTVRAETEVASEVTLPEGEARGLGADVYEGTPYLLTAHLSGTTYTLQLDGSVSSSTDVGSSMFACGFDSNASYTGAGRTLTKYPYGGGEWTDKRMPANIQSIATDKSENELWVGGENGRIWNLDAANLSIERSFETETTVFGLAHDGENLWVGEEGSDRIQRYDPESGETTATYAYPNAQTIYDYAYVDGSLWLEGDGTVYRTNIDETPPNRAPSATFTISPTTPEVGDPVSFDATGSDDPDENISSYEWDFTDDGTTDASGATTFHGFSDGGEYTVSLTVTDAEGATDTATQSLTVVEPPTADLSVSASEVTAGEEIELVATGSSDPDGTIVEYRWDLDGDGTVETTGERVTHAYESPGEYEVRVTVVDGDELTDEARSTVTVESSPEQPEEPEEPEDPEGDTGQPTDDGSGSDDTDQEDDSAESSDSVPGFSLVNGVVGVGGAAYALKRRVEGDDGSD